MIKLVVNPGAGPVENASPDRARENMQHFIVDLGIRDVQYVELALRSDTGRWPYLVWKNNRCCEIEMPGCPLSEVRFYPNQGLNVWDFYRLYVDKASWLWFLAVENVKRELSKRSR